MIPKTRRISDSKEFKPIYQARKLVRTTNFRANFDFFGQTSKFAVVAGRKVGKAVVRNKLRRQVYAIVYSHDLYARSNIQLIITINHTAAGLEHQDLKAEIHDLLSQIRFTEIHIQD